MDIMNLLKGGYQILIISPFGHTMPCVSFRAGCEKRALENILVCCQGWLSVAHGQTELWKELTESVGWGQIEHLENGKGHQWETVECGQHREEFWEEKLAPEKNQ